MTRAKIIYSGFYDAPLAFVVSHEGNQYLFWREFEDVIDDYSQTYKVFILRDLTNEEIENSWQNLHEMTSRYLGEVPVRKVLFDATKRMEIDTSIIQQLLSEGTEATTQIEQQRRQRN